MGLNYIINYMQKLKINKEIYRFEVGGNSVLIKFPDESSRLVNKKKIKGYSDPNKFKKILDKGEYWDITSKEVSKYIKEILTKTV